MSFDTRNNSALMKRAEQLRRWEESETNREPAVAKNDRGRKIKFSSGCIFLAACVAGDKEEVVRLLEAAADINTANVDGLTALHQACIDDNLEMVEFLVEHSADINRQDNEGWTPLHATSSCGLVSIARYLIENGADLTAINSDGELAIDLASSDAMVDYLQNLIDEQGIDCQKARQIEEQTMLADAKKWLRSDASEADKPHAKTGATALHVAAAKGYTRVLSLLLAGRANVDKQDNDGWTPLHAAAHWGQKESCQMLIHAMADMDIKNYAGQTCIDIAESKIVKFLEEQKANSKKTKRRPISQLRISDAIENHIENATNVIHVEVKNNDSKTTTEDAIRSNSDLVSDSDETDSDVTDSTESSHSTSISEPLEDKLKPPPEPAAPIPQDSGDEDAPWRRTGSSRTRNQLESIQQKPQVPDKEDSEVILRRTQSFENDEKFYQKYNELRARIKANSCPILPATQQTVLGGVNNTPNNYSVQRSASLKDHRYIRKVVVSPPVSPTTPAAATPNTGQVRSNNEVSETSSSQSDNEVFMNRKTDSPPKLVAETNSGSTKTKMSPGMIFKNFFKSFVPPVRDEESETQRKAHAKRVRETRRSTQGVTLDEIKSAEELVKKKNLNNNNNNASNEIPQTPSSTNITMSTTTASCTVPTNTGIINTKPVIDSLSNDRVPYSIPSSEPNEETELPSSSDSTNSSGQTSTSYTVTSVPRKNSRKDDPQQTEDASKVSATYTIIPPTTPADICSSLIIKNHAESDNIETASISATISVPLSSISSASATRQKTERSDDTAGAGLDAVSSSVTNLEINSTSNGTQAGLAPPDAGETMLPTASRDKRSLNDVESVNSLTLAEKLRHEANKYNEIRYSNNDIASVGLGETSTDIETNKEVRKCDSTPSSPLHHSTAERRPSWRLKFDAGSKFKLEDASAGTSFPPINSTIITSAPAVIAAANLSAVSQRRNNSAASSTIQTPRPVSAPVISSTTISNAAEGDSSDRVKDGSCADVTLSLRRNKISEDRENDKENDNRSAQATQALIQRRRRPKRRSTGVVHVDMDDIDPDRQDSSVENNEKESGSERTSRSRLGSTSSLSGQDRKDTDVTANFSENGEVLDYKALWEAAMLENDKLKQQLKNKDDELLTARAAIERFANATTKNSLSELEKREKRAMERKLSEMEEELKQLDTLKTENQRLKEENGALIRVISKLSK